MPAVVGVGDGSIVGLGVAGTGVGVAVGAGVGIIEGGTDGDVVGEERLAVGVPEAGVPETVGLELVVAPPHPATSTRIRSAATG